MSKLMNIKQYKSNENKNKLIRIIFTFTGTDSEFFLNENYIYTKTEYKIGYYRIEDKEKTNKEYKIINPIRIVKTIKENNQYNIETEWKFDTEELFYVQTPHTGVQKIFLNHLPVNRKIGNNNNNNVEEVKILDWDLADVQYNENSYIRLLHIKPQYEADETPYVIYSGVLDIDEYTDPITNKKVRTTELYRPPITGVPAYIPYSISPPIQVGWATKTNAIPSNTPKYYFRISDQFIGFSPEVNDDIHNINNYNIYKIPFGVPITIKGRAATVSGYYDNNTVPGNITETIMLLEK